MRKILFLFGFILSVYSYGQNNIEISLQQDAKLLFFGDNKGNDALTANLLARVEVPVYNLKRDYLSAYLSIEYANLAGMNYKRYALGAGYNIISVYKRFGAIAHIDFGKIYRQSDGFYSFSVSGEINYKINDRIKLICTQQITQRKDLTEIYNSDKNYIVSGFIGVKYSL